MTYADRECTIAQLHEWLIEVESQAPRWLTLISRDAQDILLMLLHGIPEIQEIRDQWENARPFPSDKQLLLLAVRLFGRINEPDGEILGCLDSILSLMSNPDPIPQKIHFKFREKTFWFEEGVPAKAHVGSACS